MERREVERLTRRAAVAFTRWVVHAHRWTVDRAAATLGLREKTLSAWRDGWRKDRLRIELLGRKPGRGDAEERNLLLALFYLLGEGAGPRALADLFPRLSLAEVTEILSSLSK